MIDRPPAIFSPCRLYRYVLWREWSDDLFKNRTHEGYVQWICLNPSTATETIDDPTIRKCRGFTKRWGYNAMVITNLFAFRATDPRKMMGCPKPIGDENDRWIVACARDASLVIAAWGTRGSFMARDKEVCNILPCELKCLRLSKTSGPWHPLYVPYDTQLFDYDPSKDGSQKAR